MTDANAGKKVGNYEILSKLGQGGMGAVFKARQLSMDRVVALKILPPKLAKNADFVARFMREAKSAGMISHPNLIQVYDVGIAGTYHYFSMEFVDGPTLKEHFKEHGPLDEAVAIDLMRQIAEALRTAHDKGIVHRDVKPDNVLLTSHGQAKLADLGLAKPMSGEADVTMGGNAIGTPAYMSPEQAKGEDCDGRADLYSLGATFHHLLSGQALFTAPTGSGVSVKHVTEAPESIRQIRKDVSVGMEAILLRLLEKQPGDRYQSAADLLTDLRALADGSLTSGASGRGPATRPGTRAGSRTGSGLRPAAGGPPLGLLVGGGVGLVALIAILLMVLGGDGDDDDVSESEQAVEPPPVVQQDPPEEVEPPVADPDPDQTATDSASDMLAFAKTYAAEHPEDFATARTYFLKARKAGAGTIVEFEVDEALRALEGRWDAYAEKEWQALRKRAQTKVDDKDIDGALQLLAGADKRWAQRRAEELKRFQRDAKTLADQAFAQLLDQAETAFAGKRFAEAEQALAGIDVWQYRQGQQDVARLVKRLRERLGQASQQVKAAAELATWQAQQELADRYLQRLIDGDLDRAKSLLDQSRSVDAGFRKELGQVRTALLDRQRAVRDWLTTQKGKEFTLPSPKGERSGSLDKIDDTGLRLRQRMEVASGSIEATHLIKWEDLSDAVIRGWKEAWSAKQPADHLALIVCALREEERPRAKSLLKHCGSHAMVPAVQRQVGIKVDAPQPTVTEPDPAKSEDDRSSKAGPPLGSGPSLLANPGFERSLSSWAPVGNGKVSVAKRGGKEGRHFAAVRPEGEVPNAGLTQKVQVAKGWHRLSAWHRLHRHDARFALAVRVPGVRSALEARAVLGSEDPVGTTWRCESILFWTEAGELEIRVGSGGRNPMQSGSLDIDGVVLERVTVPTRPPAHSFTYGSGKGLLVTDRTTPEMARRWCKEAGAKLISVGTAREKSHLLQALRTAPQRRSFLLADQVRDGQLLTPSGRPQTMVKMGQRRLTRSEGSSLTVMYRDDRDEPFYGLAKGRSSVGFACWWP